VFLIIASSPVPKLYSLVLENHTVWRDALISTYLLCNCAHQQDVFMTQVSYHTISMINQIKGKNLKKCICWSTSVSSWTKEWYLFPQFGQ